MLRITSFNVHYGRKTEKIAKVLKGNDNLSKTDILLLQEVEDHPQEGSPRALRIASALGYYCSYAPARPAKKTGGTHGLAILSKYPLEEIRTLHLPYYKMYFNSRKRIAQVCRVKAKGTSFYLCNIHLDARLNARHRIEQLAYAIKYLKSRLPHPLVIGGDLNTIPFYMALKSIPLPYSNQYKKVHEFMVAQGFDSYTNYRGSTMRRGWVGMKLDHIYSLGLPIIGCGVEKGITVSDHKPVWADISLEPVLDPVEKKVLAK